MKKRIAIWMHGGLGSGTGSQEQPSIKRFIERLALYYTVDVYTNVAPDRSFSKEGFTVYAPNTNARWGGVRWLGLLSLFVSHHRKAKYDLLYALWGYPSGLLIVLLGSVFRLPSVIHLQGGDAAYVPSLGYGVFCHPIRRRACLWAYSKCNLLIALTHYQKQFLVRFGVSREVHVIPYGVDTDVFSYKPKLFSPVIRFLHVGNQTPVKDQETLLRAFATLIQRVPATLTFVGPDHDNGRIRRLCIELQIERYVSFPGSQPYAELPKYYHTSDVLIHTSLYEGQGLVFTEAAACGTLLAGTEVGVLSDMGENCGIIAPVRDAGTLANRIMSVLSSPLDCDSKRKAARRWVVEKNEDFTVRRIVEELNRLLFRES